MKIIVENEAKEIVIRLKQAGSYLDCENIILNNLKKHSESHQSGFNIEIYVKNLLVFFEDKTVINKGNKDFVNYNYAATFLKSIISTPYWHCWI